MTQTVTPRWKLRAARHKTAHQRRQKEQASDPDGSVVQNAGRHAAGERTQEEGEGDQGEHASCRFDFGLPVPDTDWNTASPNCRRLPVGMVDA